MKNISLALNIVLLIAVAVLYFLHFKSSAPRANGGEGASSSALSDLKIAYVKSDSVLKHYDYLDVSRQKLEDKSKKLTQEYQNRAQGLQNEFNDYQRNAGNLTIAQARAVEENLAKKEQNLRMYEQSLNQEMMNEESLLQKDLYERVTAFLKEYGKQKGLQVVLKYDPTSDVLWSTDSLDITNDVIKGLNDQYKQQNPEKEKTEGKPSKNK